MINTRKLLKTLEKRSLVSDKFHKSSSNKKIVKIDLKDIPESWIKINFKTYPRLPKVYFKHLLPDKISTLIKKRRSVREFNGSPISLKQLHYLLLNAAGIINSYNNIDQSRRPYPSAGARYPLEVYPLVLKCMGLEKGLYHYNVKENCLELLQKGNLEKELLKGTAGEELLKDAAVIFIITGVLDRTRIKYHERGYRFVLIEAGHLAQNICLLATELGLGCCPLGGFIDSYFDKLLDISLQKEFSLYLLAVGKV